MSCGCNDTCGGCGSGLHGLLGEIGSIIELKCYLRWTPGGYSIGQDEPGIKDLIEGCIYQTGLATSVDVSESGWGLFNHLIQIRVTTPAVLSNVADGEPLTDFPDIVWELQNCAGLVVEIYDQRVVSLGSPVAAAPDIAQAIQERDRAAQPQAVNKTPCKEGYYDNGIFSVNCVPYSKQQKCDWNSLGLGDYFACQLGLTPSMGVIAGVGLALIGVIAISKIAK